MIKFLSSVKAYYVLLTLTLILRVIFEINYPKLISDHSIQIEAAKNFVNNGHMERSWVNASDLSVVNAEPLKMWPVGLSFLVVFFNMFTRDMINAEICFQALGVILFILGSVRVLKYFNTPLLSINLFLLLYAFNPAPFSYLGSTDLFTIGLFIWIIYFSLLECRSKNINYLNLTSISILSFFAAIIRFACIPNVVIIPVVFLVIYFFKKEKGFLLKSFGVMMMSTALIFIFYKLFPIDNSRTGFIQNIKDGNFYFSHLKWFDPFSLKGFFYVRPIEFRLPNNSFIIGGFMVSAIVAAIAFYFFILKQFMNKLRFKSWISNFKSKSDSEKDHMSVILLVTTLVIIGFVSLQSLTTPPESNSFGPPWMPPLWTFVYCTRYFAYVMILLMVMFFILFNWDLNNILGRFFRSIYVLCFGWAFALFMFSNYHLYASNGNGNGSSWVNDRSAIETYRIINSISNNDENLVYAHFKKKRNEGLVTNYSKAFPSDDYNKIVNNEFGTSKAVSLLLSMPGNLSTIETKFLQEHSHTLLRNFGNEQLIQFNLK